MPVDFHLIGLPSKPGSVFATAGWISGTGPRFAAGRGPLRATVGAALDEPGVVTCALVETVAEAGESCANRVVAETIAKLVKLTIRNEGLFTNWIVVPLQQKGQSTL